MRDDIIANTLNLTPIEGEYESRDLPAIPQKRVSNDTKQIETDVDYVRGNLYDMIEHGTRSMDELMSIANQSQHPRAYEVISTMMKTLVDTNKELLDMHEKKQKLLGEKPVEKKSETVNNNLFVGSTKDLLEMIKKQNENVED
jgi:hypothetical protein